MCLDKLCQNQDEVTRYRCHQLKKRCFSFLFTIILSSFLLGIGVSSLAIGVKKNKKAKTEGKDLILIGCFCSVLGLFAAGTATVYFLCYSFITVTQDRWPTSKDVGFIKKRFGLK